MELRECTASPNRRQAQGARKLDGQARSLVACGFTAAHEPTPWPEAPTLRRSVWLVVLLVPLAVSCGSWKRVGAPDTPIGTEQMPRVFDPTAIFRQMGLIADAGPLAIVGSVRLLAGPPPDTTLVLVALSLHNRGLTFRRDGNAFTAEYRVELQFRRGTEMAQQVTRDERIRIPNFRETLRTEESVIFQQVVPVASGEYTVDVTVRDRNGPNVSRSQVTVAAPRVIPPTVAAPVAVYEVTPRTSLTTPPQMVANPRYAVAFGTDSLRFYIESYGMPAGSALALAVSDPNARVVYEDTVRLDSSKAVDARVVTIPSTRLGIGRHEMRVSVVGGGLLTSAPFLVAFSDLWAIANLEDMVNLLRYFAPADTLRGLANAPAEERAAAWLRFWRATDPNPVTPENEALDRYFARIQIANQRFSDEGTPGWLTDRGEVFVTIGEPDQAVDPTPGVTGRGRAIFWIYNTYRLQLVFVDDVGFGRFRLDPRSRSEYLVVLNRLRRQ